MHKIFKFVNAVSIVVLSMAGSAFAQDTEGEAPSIVPVEIYVCSYNEGKGSADLDKWSAKWNDWADSKMPEAYSAWTLTPFYYGADQDFDFLWLGVSPDAVTLGRAYDNYLSNSGDLQAQFEQMAACPAHSNYATMNIKKAPDDRYGDSFVISFSDCKIAEGKSFEDASPALQAWSEYRSGHGSEAGMWILWPAYGGGDAEFDFKFVASHPNYASLGADYDQYARGGYAKAEELFKDILECNESRAYNATQRRDGMPDE